MRKGIILAGGKGSRLFPITKSCSKQLLPVYDKPMIFYPLTTLMLSGIRDILIITNERFLVLYERLFGNGSQLGININYKIQERPDGIAQAFLLGADFIGSDEVCLILGDNIFYGNDLQTKLLKANLDISNPTIFAYRVNDPERYGVVEFNNGKAISIYEKPKKPKSNYAITGIYFYDNSVVELSKTLKPSKRGELEISSINEFYLKKNKLKVEVLGRGYTWLDTGTFQSLHDASLFIKTIQERQGLKIGVPEEIAWRNGWINDQKLKEIVNSYSENSYGEYLKILLN